MRNINGEIKFQRLRWCEIRKLWRYWNYLFGIDHRSMLPLPNSKMVAVWAGDLVSHNLTLCYLTSISWKKVNQIWPCLWLFEETFIKTQWRQVKLHTGSFLAIWSSHNVTLFSRASNVCLPQMLLFVKLPLQKQKKEKATNELWRAI